MVASDVDHVQSQPLEKYKEEIKSLQMEIEILKEKTRNAPDSVNSARSERESAQIEEKVVEILEVKSIIPHPIDAPSIVVDNKVAQLQATQSFGGNTNKYEEVSQELLMTTSNGHNTFENVENVSNPDSESRPEERRPLLKSYDLSGGAVPENTASSFFSCLSPLYSLSLGALPKAFSSAGIWDGFLFVTLAVPLMFLFDLPFI